MSAPGLYLPRAVEPDRSGHGVQPRRTTVTTLGPSTIWAVPDQARTIYAHAREAPMGRTLFVSGQFGVAPDGRMRAEFTEQLGQAMANAEALLAAAGMVLADVRKATFILTRTDDLRALELVRRARWASDAPAAVTVLVSAALARPDALVEVEVTAVQPPALGEWPGQPGERTAGILGRIVRWAQSLVAARGRRVDRLDEQGDWLLRDLGLERSDIQSAAERVDELRRRMPFQ